tara:strand:- start:65 stop:1204 length:1140 start_codon:yes stop_codon:yes gene_type:complete
MSNNNNNNRRVRRRLYVPANLSRYGLNVKNINNTGYRKNNNLKYTNIPSEIRLFTQLEKLDMSSHNLTSIPPSIGKLQNLKKLYLGSNKLTSLPREIYNLEKLNVLHLGNEDLPYFSKDGNKVTISNDIRKLGNLTHLNLCKNYMNSIPDDIVKLGNLTHLDLSQNNLKSIPDDIGKLKNLTYLDLSRNNLKSIPPSIGKLKKLRVLNLSYNKLTSLPKEIENIASLSSLNVMDNPGLKGISSELEKNGLTIYKHGRTKFVNHKYYTNQLSTITVKRKNLPRLPPKIRENIARKVNKPPKANTEAKKMNVARSSVRAYGNKQKVLTRRFYNNVRKSISKSEVTTGKPLTKSVKNRLQKLYENTGHKLHFRPSIYKPRTL